MAEGIDYEAVIRLQEIYQREPWRFFKDALGVEDKSLWAAPLEIMNALINHKRVAVKAGHGVSKSFTIARLILWWLCSYYPSKVVSTAPTYSQVARILWSELAAAYKRALRPIGGDLHNTELIFGPDWFGMGLSTDEEQRMQGFHSENLLVIFDEAGGVKPEIWNAARGLVTGENSRWLVVGNPLQSVGDFYNCFKTDSGWYPITISCLDTPNYISRKEVIPGMTTYGWVEQARKEFGEDSALWYSKVLGQFPVEAGNTLIPLAWVENCRREKIDLDKLLGVHREQRFIGVDVARFGICSTVITVFDGWNMLYQREFSKRSNTEVAGFIIDTLRDEQNMEAPIAIDDTGLGGGVYDILKEQGYNVVQVILRSKSDNEEKFYDLRTEVYWDLRDKFQKGMIAIKDPDANPRKYDKLVAELTSQTYEMDKRGRIKVTPKERMLKEIMKKGGDGESPDRADSLSLAVYASKNRKKRGNRVKNPYDKMFAGKGAGGY
jgi:phage terminase large subunit